MRDASIAIPGKKDLTSRRVSATTSPMTNIYEKGYTRCAM
jgi:hypothetical protein